MKKIAFSIVPGYTSLKGIFHASYSEQDIYMKNDEFETSNRDTLVTEYLEAHGIFSFEGAPNELINAAHAHADKILGTNNDN